MQRAFPRVLGEVGDPAVEQIGEKLEERPVRVELADQGLHVDPHPLAADVRDEREQIALVREVLEETALRDTGLTRDDVQAAAGKSVRAEFGLCGLDDGCATSG